MQVESRISCVSGYGISVGIRGLSIARQQKCIGMRGVACQERAGACQECVSKSV